MRNHAIAQWCGELGKVDAATVQAFQADLKSALPREAGFRALVELIRPRQAEMQWMMVFEDGKSLKQFIEGSHRNWFERAAGVLDMEPAVLARRPLHYRTPHSPTPRVSVQVGGLLAARADGLQLPQLAAALVRSLETIDSFCGIDWLVDPDHGLSQVHTLWRDADGFQQYLDRECNELAEFIHGISEELLAPAPYLIVDQLGN